MNAFLTNYLANIIPQKQRESNRFRLLSPICTKVYFTQVSVLFAEFARCVLAASITSV